MTDTSSKLVLLRCSGINEDDLAMLERNGEILLSHNHFQGKSAANRRPLTRYAFRQPAAIQHKGTKLYCHGNRELLNEPLHAVLCSKACPGHKIIEAIDLAQRWRAENRAVISGFHTPVEKECLRIFLRGPQRIVICPARGLDPFLLPADWQQKFKRVELLIVSPFDSSIRRPNKETTEVRTRLVLSLAQSKTIIHASPGGFLGRVLERIT